MLFSGLIRLFDKSPKTCLNRAGVVRWFCLVVWRLAYAILLRKFTFFTYSVPADCLPIVAILQRFRFVWISLHYWRGRKLADDFHHVDDMNMWQGTVQHIRIWSKDKFFSSITAFRVRRNIINDTRYCLFGYLNYLPDYQIENEYSV